MRKNPLGNRRGAQVIEFALTVPILLFIVSATVDYGWYFQQRMVLTTATQQAAKAAANDADDPTGVATAVGQTVWHSAGMRDYPEFVTSVISPSAGTDSNGVPIAASGADDCIEVTSTIDVECLVCLGLVPMAQTISHTAVEYYNEQAGASGV